MWDQDVRNKSSHMLVATMGEMCLKGRTASSERFCVGNMSLVIFKVRWKVNGWDKADFSIKRAKQGYCTDCIINFYMLFNKVLRDSLASISGLDCSKLSGVLLTLIQPWQRPSRPKRRCKALQSIQSAVSKVSG